MDLTQNKLSKSEWNSIEIAIPEGEQNILMLILNGYASIDIKINHNKSLFQFLSIEYNTEIEFILFKEYFEKDIDAIYNLLIMPPPSTSVIKTKKHRSNKPTIPPPIINEIITREFISALDIWKNSLATGSLKTPKKSDLIRIKNTTSKLVIHKTNIFEYLIIEFCIKVIVSLTTNTLEYGIALYTLIHLKKNSVANINSFVIGFMNTVIQIGETHTNITDVFTKAYSFIEKNPYLLKYEDLTLYPHQKQLFTAFKNNQSAPKLVLYTAPTGTGKTLSPIGLSQEFKIIFVCVARHVGLALAKSAISVDKKVAFAFGCETAADIRLHYFSALSYTKNRKSGGIGKVDNSVGDKVEIMICDVKSYITAMHYMLSFNTENEIITYWDEPTITMDYPDHNLHALIHQNWIGNLISKVVLSCATLPTEHEIMDTIMDFRGRFPGTDGTPTEIITIDSFDCKKTISILGSNGKCVLPHLLFSKHNELLDCVAHCHQNKTLLRYMDLKEIIRFIKYISTHQLFPELYSISSYFPNISAITMNSIKIYYLNLLERIPNTEWTNIYTELSTTQEPMFNDIKPNNNFRSIQSMCQLSSTNQLPSTEPYHIIGGGVLTRSASVDYLPSTVPSTTPSMTPSSIDQQVVPIEPEIIIPKPPNTSGIMLTTTDANTLTDGPTIYLANDISKIGQFCIKQLNLSEKVFNGIMEKIENNNNIQKQMDVLSQVIEDAIGSECDKEKKMERERYSKDVIPLMNKLEKLQGQIKSINLDAIYIPNTASHQKFWMPDDTPINKNAYVPIIEEIVVRDIMCLDVSSQMKLLLLLGIGMFVNEPNAKYMEIMKQLAQEQKLYIIIATSDYIYGTNYQFCHGFIGKDLSNMTRQKIIQSMGRIGRRNIQQEYTVRFRNDDLILKLFKSGSEEENIEAINMGRLFCS
jgi:hypothetical protein